MKLSVLAKRLLSLPYIDWSEMPAELQEQRPILGPGAVRSAGRIVLQAGFGVCQLRELSQ